MRLLGEFVILQNAIAVKSTDDRKLLAITLGPGVRDKLILWPSMPISLEMTPRYKIRRSLVPENEDNPLRLLFYRASHHRQRLVTSECRGMRLIKKGNASIIAVIRTDSLIVFRHRDTCERVFFDGDNIITRVVREEQTL